MSCKVFYTDIWWFSSHPKNMFKVFPHISGLDNTVFVKGQYDDILITIDLVTFNLDSWLLIIIHHTNPLVNLWQISSEWCKILVSIHHQTALQLYQKILGQPLSKWLSSFSLQFFFISIFRTRLFLLSRHINAYYHKIHVKYQLTITTWYHLNPCCW